MKVVLFGATGMVGQGVLRECLQAADVEAVVVVSRSPTGVSHPKLREVAHQDFTSFSTLEPLLRGFDACFFCLGVTSAGMDEAAYSKVTYDIAVAAARAFARASPGATFVYVSGAGTDSTEKGRSTWARVKGRTENAILREDLKGVMFRPGFIQPLDGIRSKTKLYRAIYAVLRPVGPLLRRLAPNAATTTRDVGLAMLQAAAKGAPRIVETRDITALAAARKRAA